MTFGLLLIGFPAAAGLAGLLFRHRGLARSWALIAPAFTLYAAVMCGLVKPQFALSLADFGPVEVELALDITGKAAAVAIATAFVRLPPTEPWIVHEAPAS